MMTIDFERRITSLENVAVLKTIVKTVLYAV